MSDPISTSPLAKQALDIIRHMDALIGSVEAQMWMLKGNEVLGGVTPVTAIKERRTGDVLKAVRVVALERGFFEEPFRPVKGKKK